MKRSKLNRALIVAGLLSCVILGISIIISQLNQSLTFFYSPTEIHTIATKKENIKVGGIVKPGSIKKSYDGKELIINFSLTDCEYDIHVSYHGTLPPLFREKQGIVALGSLDKDKLFVAHKLLTKHDENYIPKELNNTISSEESICNPKHFKK